MKRTMMIKKLLLTTVLCSAFLVNASQAADFGIDYASEFPAVGEPSPAYRLKMNTLLAGLNDAVRPDYIKAMHMADAKDPLNDSLRYDRMDVIGNVPHALLSDVMGSALELRTRGTLTSVIRDLSKLRTDSEKGSHYQTYIAGLRKVNSGSTILADIYHVEKLSPDRVVPVTDKVLDVAHRYPQLANYSLFGIVADANLETFEDYLAAFERVTPQIPETPESASSSGAYGPSAALPILVKVPHDNLNAVTDKFQGVAQRFTQLASSSLLDIVANTTDLSSFEDYLEAFTRVLPHVTDSSSDTYGPLGALRTLTTVPHGNLNAVTDKFSAVTQRFPKLAGSSLFGIIATADLNTFEDYLSSYTEVAAHLPERLSASDSSSGNFGPVVILQELVKFKHENLHNEVTSSIDAIEKIKANKNWISSGYHDFANIIRHAKHYLES
ncbi:MAG: hypothetical protein K2W94_01680 [Alphaproteobacteria bacterium]|nr:hypothetical protein [Alphaproteobacteria bacterium]